MFHKVYCGWQSHIFVCADAKMWNASRFCVSSLRRGHANLLCIVPILVYVLPKQVHRKWSKTCIESIATQVAEIKRWLCRPTVLSPAWPCGLMDKAPDFGSGDCRFESCHGRDITFWAGGKISQIPFRNRQKCKKSSSFVVLEVSFQDEIINFWSGGWLAS